MHVANHVLDGFDLSDPITHRPTVYKFYGCLVHGCSSSFPIHCNRFPICHKDRTLQEVYESTLRKQETLRLRLQSEHPMGVCLEPRIEN